MSLTFDRFRAGEAHPTQSPDCLGDIDLAAAADGAASAEVLSHLSRCAACRSALAHLARLLGDDAVAGEVGRLDAVPSHRWRGPLLIAAAAAVALMVAIPGIRSGDGDRFRDDPVVGSRAAPVLLEPRDSISGVTALRWSGVPAATQYRITLFDEEGALVWSAETADTTIAPPPDVELTAGTPYWWRVEARVDFDRWTASALGAFVIPEQPR